MRYKPYKTQPQSPTTVDKNHWLAKRLTSAFVPAIYGGVDVLGRAIPAPVQTTTGLTVKTTVGGKGVEQGASTNWSHTGKAVSAPTGFPIVMLSYGYFTSSSSSYIQTYFTQASVGTSGENCVISLFSSTAIAYRFRTGYGSTATASVTTGSGTTTGQLFCMMSMSLSATDHRFFVDGVKASSSTNTGTPTNSFNQMSIGGPGFTGLVGGLVYCAYGHQAFTDEECISITKDPTIFWQMFNRYGNYYPLVQLTGSTAIFTKNTFANQAVNRASTY